MLLLQQLKTGCSAATEIPAGDAANGISTFYGVSTARSTAAGAAAVRSDVKGIVGIFFSDKR